MDHKFTEQIRQWLETHEDERDYAVGALYLLKLSGNQIMYRNLLANPSAKADFIVYQIQKYYNFRVQALTHAQVEEMAAQVQTIADERLCQKRLAYFDTVSYDVREKTLILPFELYRFFLIGVRLVSPR